MVQRRTHSIRIVLHGSIRTEVAHSKCGKNRLLRPVFLVIGPQVVDKTLSFEVGAKVIGDEVVIMLVHLEL